MRHIGWRYLLVPALSLATLAGCAADGTGPVGPAAVPLANHTNNPCDHDVTAPTILSVTASPNTLWPPNHKFVTVAVAVSATDNCSAVTSSIVGISSSEPVDWLGDGHTSPDWTFSGLVAQLRSERSGLNAGRTYTITVRAVDASGNASTSTVTVFVPHDQGKRGR